MADVNDIIHLLRRTEFVARASRVQALQALTIEQAVDDVLDFSLNTTTPPPTLLVDDPNNRYGQRVAMHDWWINTMVSATRPFQEKLTLFWHGHFVSDYSTTERTDLLMQQISLYRSMSIGNFRSFTHAMALNPMMLRYLSGANNVKGSPNENFSRELMELFTLGVGNYTQPDVTAAARAWTGHNLDSTTQTYVFRPTQHDNNNKTFFGTTKNWDGPEIIDEILRDNTAKRAIAARYMSRKLWEFLAYPNPASEILDDLSLLFISNDLELRPLIRAILLRPEFYSLTARQGLVRSPVDWSVALLAHSGLTATQAQIFNWSLQMGQRVMDPPNVAGWENNADYLTTGSLSGRANVARRVASQLRLNNGFNYLYAMTPAAAVDNVAAFFGVVLADNTRTAITNAYTNERTAVGGSQNTAATNLLVMIMLTGEMNVP